MGPNTIDDLEEEEPKFLDLLNTITVSLFSNWEYLWFPVPSQLELGWLMGVYHYFQQLFSYIETTKQIVGENPG